MGKTYVCGINGKVGKLLNYMENVKLKTIGTAFEQHFKFDPQDVTRSAKLVLTTTTYSSVGTNFFVSVNEVRATSKKQREEKKEEGNSGNS